MANSWVKKAVATAAIAAGLVVAAPAAANAGIYTWHFQATYSSNEACVAAGKAGVRSGEADAYRCTGTGGVDLYFGYIW